MGMDTGFMGVGVPTSSDYTWRPAAKPDPERTIAALREDLAEVLAANVVLREDAAKLRDAMAEQLAENAALRARLVSLEMERMG